MAEDLAEQFDVVDFDAAFREMAHAVWTGYAVAEIIWQSGTGRVEIAAIRTRAPERFRFGAGGGLRLISRTHPRGAAVPEAKFWLARMPAEHGDQAHGPGAGRLCFWPVWLKRNGIRYWAVALEKFGMPTPIGKHGHNASPEDIDLLLETLQRLAQGAGIAIPEGQEIAFLEAQRRSGGDHAAFCTYMDALVVEAVLLQTATTEMGPWKGTAEVQKLVRDERVATLSRLLCAGINRTVARWLTDWNFPGAAYPRLVREISPPEDLNARAQRDEIVARMSGMRPAKSYIEDTYGGAWEDAPAPNAGGRFAFADPVPSLPRDDIDTLADEAEDAAQNVADRMIEQIHGLVEHAASFDDVSQGLLTLYPDISGEGLAGSLRKALTVAELMGRANIVDR